MFVGLFDYGIAIQLQQVLRIKGQKQAGETDGYGGVQLDEDAESRTSSILERIAYRIASYSSLIARRALAAAMTGRDALLDVVPGTAGVGHRDSYGKAPPDRTITQAGPRMTAVIGGR